MQILDLIAPGRVVADARIPNKKRLLEQLAKLLDERGDPDTERALFDSLVKREKLGSTGLGQGVAIPHGRSPEIGRAVGAFVRLAEPIEFNAADGKPVDLVFALVVPEHFTDQHLMFLAALAEMFSDAAITARLRSARDGAALYDALAGWHERNAAA
jgi:PTS system nitrogen regulatory IIA component